MSDLLLQTIVEKLETFETLLKQVATDKSVIKQNDFVVQLQPLQTDIKKMNEHFLLNQRRMSELELRINILHESLQQRLKNQIEHEHHFHKGIWIAIILFLVSSFFFFQWINATNNKKQFEANDIKYRALKATGDKALLKVIYHTDSLYNLDPEHMQQWVIQEEDRLIEQTKKYQLADEKKKEAKDLRDGAEKK